MTTIALDQKARSNQASAGETIPLRQWLWRSYLRSAIVPLLVIEITFLLIFWGSNAVVYRENVAAVSGLSHVFIDDVAQRQSDSIATKLAGISSSTNVFARQALRALNGSYDPPATEKDRYARAPSGAIYTRFDNGTSASFYSGIHPIGLTEIGKVWKLAAIDPIMIDIKSSDPSISSVYFNSFDSYNRIYPYIHAVKQYPSKMDIPKYNFYYEADAQHNPARKAVWTDAYLDPAGQGWMVSSIAPVWNGDKLEGVVGLDVTLSTIIDSLSNLSLPSSGYAILVDRKGRILAIPPKGEADFGIKELTTVRYDQAIQQDQFKPDAFDITKRKDTRLLAEAMSKSDRGRAIIQFDGPHQASFATIAGPGWRLVVIVPIAEIQRGALTLKSRLETVGLVMLAGLFLFYMIFFVMLYRRAQKMSERIASPLSEIAALLGRIGKGNYHQNFEGYRISELDDLGRQLVRTGKQLGDAHDQIIEQERLVARSLVRQRQANEEQIRFVRMISHELRTPLSVIDSGAQIVDRKADKVAPEDIRLRMGKLRKAVQRISQLLNKLVDSSIMESDEADTELLQTYICPLVAQTALSMVPENRLRMTISELHGHYAVIEDGAIVSIALRTLLDNAVLYSGPEDPISVSVQISDGFAKIDVVDYGAGVSEEELEKIGERYFRGSASIGKEGAGISIHVARKLLDRIGGRIRISSGNGVTKATVFVPVTLESMLANDRSWATR